MTEKTRLPRSDIARIVMNFVRHTFNHEGGNVCRKKHFNVVTNKLLVIIILINNNNKIIISNNYGLLCIVRTYVFLYNKNLIKYMLLLRV